MSWITDRRVLILAAVAFSAGVATARLPQGPDTFDAGGFSASFEVVVPGTPTEVFDLFTGDVSEWWDHTFSPEPLELVIEPRVGGAFYEYFDRDGNGCHHAQITFAQRGERLKMLGGLGLSGDGVLLDHDFQFVAHEDGTKLTAKVTGFGRLDEELSTVVHSVWHHFLVEQFVPFANAQ